MMKFGILFALLAAAVADPIPRLEVLTPSGRIVGGVGTTIEQVPHQVSLQVFSYHVCGGTIISANWILTAAHCMSNHISHYSVRSGSTFHSSGGTVTNITNIILHEKYFLNGVGVPHEDIALLRLKYPLTFDSTQAPAPLFASGQEIVAGVDASITGWGNTLEGGSYPDVLQTVTLPVMSFSACNQTYATWEGIRPRQFCAGVPEGGLSSCHGDSGGPVAINGVVAGIVSWGNGCARPGFPSVYTEVAPYRHWIRTHSGV